MRGSIYVIAEILVFLLAAAVIGYLIGRLTSRGDRAEPLKRLPEVDVGQAKSASEQADQSADLRRRLGIAYQTIRELEESNMLLRESAEVVSAPDDDEDDGDGDGLATMASSDDAADDDDADGHEAGDAAEAGAEDDHDGSVEEEAESEQSAADTQEPEVSDDQSPAGPAERIRAAKEAKDAAAANAASVQNDVADQLAAKDEEISRLKADLDRQMSQMGDLASRITDLEA